MASMVRIATVAMKAQPTTISSSAVRYSDGMPLYSR